MPRNIHKTSEPKPLADDNTPPSESGFVNDCLSNVPEDYKNSSQPINNGLLDIKQT